MCVFKCFSHIKAIFQYWKKNSVSNFEANVIILSSTNFEFYRFLRISSISRRIFVIHKIIPITMIRITALWWIFNPCDFWIFSNVWVSVGLLVFFRDPLRSFFLSLKKVCNITLKSFFLENILFIKCFALLKVPKQFFCNILMILESSSYCIEGF